MELNKKEAKKIFVIGLLVFFCLFSCSFWLFSDNSQTGSQEEQIVREILKRFKEGIEKGDLEVSSQITTEDFYPFFKVQPAY